MINIPQRCPTHPGEVLRNLYLEPLGISVTTLAEKLDVSRKAISTIVNKRKSVTPEMALRLSRALNTTPDIWLNLQRNYDLWQAARNTDEWRKIEPIFSPLDTSNGSAAS